MPCNASYARFIFGKFFTSTIILYILLFAQNFYFCKKWVLQTTFTADECCRLNPLSPPHHRRTHTVSRCPPLHAWCPPHTSPMLEPLVNIHLIPLYRRRPSRGNCGTAHASCTTNMGQQVDYGFGPGQQCQALCRFGPSRCGGF
jgi:hypothetical protein